MLTLKTDGGTVFVYKNDDLLGTVRLYGNLCHAACCYIEPELKRYDPEIGKELFEELRRMAGRPLQAMVGSENGEIIGFLEASGFVCRRKCYETEVCREDYRGRAEPMELSAVRRGEVLYDTCCRVMYARYLDTHRTINPWTAGYDAFCGFLPAEAVCEICDGQVVNLAFVEKNEIAYLWGTPSSRFSRFAANLVEQLFAKHGTICFESDDCDWAAMELRQLFIGQSESSFDTYILGN